MPSQSMDYQDEAEYHTSYSQQKLHPRSRQLTRIQIVMVCCILLVCVVFIVSAFIHFIEAGTSPDSLLLHDWAEVIFWLSSSILALLGIVMLFKYDWSHRAK